MNSRRRVLFSSVSAVFILGFAIVPCSWAVTVEERVLSALNTPNSVSIEYKLRQIPEGTPGREKVLAHLGEVKKQEAIAQIQEGEKRVPAALNCQNSVTIEYRLRKIPEGTPGREKVLAHLAEVKKQEAIALTRKATAYPNAEQNQSQLKTARILTVGNHGQFKGFDGLQIALSMAQDMDEIRIEKGIIKGTGLTIAENSVWKQGVKMSGGWDETFSTKSNNPEDTTIDGAANGLETHPRIFTLSNKRVFVENIAFKNSRGGAIELEGYGVFTDCIFSNNSARHSGGAVFGKGTFNNCQFINNTSELGGYGGGAVFGNSAFHNCTFTNNSSRYGGGGAVSGNATFDDCTFINNMSEDGYGGGGAVFGNGTFNNCKFVNNSSKSGGGGGAVEGVGNFNNCVFANNSSEYNGGGNGGGAVKSVNHDSHFYSMDSSFSNCVFLHNSSMPGDGGAVNGAATFNNCTFYGNKARRGTGGAFYGKGRILNSIFYNNSASQKPNDIMAVGSLNIDFSLFNYLSGGAAVGGNIAMGDPKLVAPDNGDLHLSADSPGIKNGRNMGADEAVLTSVVKDYKPIPEVLQDNKTGLMWVKDVDSAGCNYGKTLDWDSAVAFCAGLTYAGYSDWRIPNKEELRLQGNTFGNYWIMGVMQFNNGFNTYANKTDNSYVCCVRNWRSHSSVNRESRHH